MSIGYERRWETRRQAGRSAADEARDSYYGLPAIHKPHWKWSIVLYFFLGGISGASYVVATLARLFGGPEMRPVARAGRYLSFLTVLPGPLLLIYDLGRPERFHHMLRVLKLRSPMSLGVWGLIAFSLFSGLSALIQAAQDGLLGRRGPARLLRAMPDRLVGLLGSGPAFFLSGYTGVLLAATAVPLWTKNFLLLGPLFLSSALSNAVAALFLLLSATRQAGSQALERLERLDRLALLAELALLFGLRANSGPVIGRPLDEGRLGQAFRGVLGAGVVAPLLLQALARGRHSGMAQALRLLVGLLVLAGGFLLRYVMVFAGHRSADDPQATFELARKR
ncbi:polysulfide reductase NrfD [Thermomicrobiaceae bacterium CFH 74404]|uniref:Polysulfide reductase NrfD n=1 Tax=Thermalbibacter longus TaxID=2951981 RepID=A0AA42BBH0_9BACT|nr:NrfD/PsrC family molybdoenzyme membrane anchor subunit [Thermalbibacter longus]MCM8747783.1 polysulfide reductase NrfD [Thermalbibacter longus]